MLFMWSVLSTCNMPFPVLGLSVVRRTSLDWIRDYTGWMRNDSNRLKLKIALGSYGGIFWEGTGYYWTEPSLFEPDSKLFRAAKKGSRLKGRVASKNLTRRILQERLHQKEENKLYEALYRIYMLCLAGWLWNSRMKASCSHGRNQHNFTIFAYRDHGCTFQTEPQFMLG